MGAAYGKKKGYSITHERPHKNGKHSNSKAQSEQHHRGDSRKPPPPDYTDDITEHDLIIQPRKLLNPVKASHSHQELHRELMSRGGGGVEVKPELQRVLESRRREQLRRQRREDEETRRKVSPLEEELRKRGRRLEEEEKQKEREKEENLKAPEFLKVKENLRRTSLQRDEQTV